MQCWKRPASRSFANAARCRKRGCWKLVATGNFDAFLCGDDAITRAVMQKALPRLKVVSKYGIGLDKVDVKAATDLKVPVCYCPRRQPHHRRRACVRVAARHLPGHRCRDAHVKAGTWKRLTGHES